MRVVCVTRFCTMAFLAAPESSLSLTLSPPSSVSVCLPFFALSNYHHFGYGRIIKTFGCVLMSKANCMFHTLLPCSPLHHRTRIVRSEMLIIFGAHSQRAMLALEMCARARVCLIASLRLTDNVGVPSENKRTVVHIRFIRAVCAFLELAH